jgi:hypothetical protein
MPHVAYLETYWDPDPKLGKTGYSLFAFFPEDTITKLSSKFILHRARSNFSSNQHHQHG